MAGANVTPDGTGGRPPARPGCTTRSVRSGRWVVAWLVARTVLIPAPCRAADPRGAALDRFERGVRLEQEGRADAASAAYLEAIRLDPRFAPAHFNLGRLRADAGDVGGARAAFEAAVLHAPGAPAQRFHLGIALRKLGLLEDARWEFTRAVDLAPDEVPARNNLAAVLVQLGRLDEARFNLEHALRLDPGSATAHNNLGIVLALEGDLARAAGRFRRVLDLDPAHPDARVHLAEVLLRQGDHEAARAEYEAVLRDRPDHGRARAGLARAQETATRALYPGAGGREGAPVNGARPDPEDLVEPGEPAPRASRAVLAVLAVLAMVGAPAAAGGDGAGEPPAWAFRRTLERGGTVAVRGDVAPHDVLALVEIGRHRVTIITDSFTSDQVERFRQAGARMALGGSPDQWGEARPVTGVPPGGGVRPGLMRAGGEPGRDLSHGGARPPQTPPASPPASRPAGSSGRAIPDRPGSRLRDVTRAAGLDFVHHAGFPVLHVHQTTGPGVAVLDFDGDGFEDLFFTNGMDLTLPATAPVPAGVSASSRLYRNDGDGTFTDATAAAGLALRMPGLSTSAPDLDNDGHPDLVICGIGMLRVFRNTGDGRFLEDPSSIRATIPRGRLLSSAAFGDLDRDGFLDGYVSSYDEIDVEALPARPGLVSGIGCTRPMPESLNPSVVSGAPDLLLRNAGGAFLEDVTREALGPEAAAAPTRSFQAVMVDLDGSGDLEILVTRDMQDNAYYRRSPAALVDRAGDHWLNDTRGNMGVAVGDFDGDMDLDLFVTHWCRQESALLRNESPRPFFSDVLHFSGVRKDDLDEVGWGASFVDLDHDGFLDLFVVNGSTHADHYPPETYVTTSRNPPMPQAPGVYRGAGSRFEPVTREVGLGDVRWAARSVATFDRDRDGDRDLAIACNNAPAVLLDNDGPPGRWIVLSLVGTRSNRQGVGSVVVVSAGDRSRLGTVLAGSSFLAQESLDVHVGVGDASRVDRAEIRWPSGVVQTLEHLDTGRFHRIVEPHR